MDYKLTEEWKEWVRYAEKHGINQQDKKQYRAFHASWIKAIDLCQNEILGLKTERDDVAQQILTLRNMMKIQNRLSKFAEERGARKAIGEFQAKKLAESLKRENSEKDVPFMVVGACVFVFFMFALAATF